MILVVVLVMFFLLVAGLVWFLLHNDRGSKEPIGALWAAAGFGFLALIVGGILESVLLSQSQLEGKASLYSFLAFMVVGLIEEGFKFVPLAIFVWKKPYFNEVADGIIYFAISGLTFGLAENILYAIGFGAGAGLGRILLVPFFHAATSSIIGYTFAKAKVEHKPLTNTVIVGVCIALLHGLYDFGISSRNVPLTLMGLAITIGLTTTLFVLYSKAIRDDQEHGRMAFGHNAFCRTCGKPNPNHMLYCQYCGKLA